MTTLAHSVGQGPGIATLAILRLHKLLLWLLDFLMYTNVDESLLVEELLVNITNQFLCNSLHTEQCNGLDQHSSRRQISLAFQLPQVCFQLSLVLGVRYFLHIFIKEGSEFLIFHGLSKVLEFSM